MVENGVLSVVYVFADLVLLLQVPITASSQPILGCRLATIFSLVNTLKSVNCTFPLFFPHLRFCLKNNDRVDLFLLFIFFAFCSICEVRCLFDDTLN